MSDIYCTVCGEPWDAYGVHHGDMLEWEARLFKAGAGCPSCEGQEPTDAETLDPSVREDLRIESARSMADGWDDPDSFPLVLDIFTEAVTGKAPKRPEWKEPERPKLWTCAGCNASVVREWGGLVEKSTELAWTGGDKVHYWHGIAFKRGDSLDRGDIDAEPPHKIADKPYCDLCAQTCDGDTCRDSIFSRSDLFDDTYSPGASFPGPRHHNDSLCLACFELQTSEDEIEANAEAIRDLARDCWNKRFAEWPNDDVRAFIAEQLKKRGIDR